MSVTKAWRLSKHLSKYIASTAWNILTSPLSRLNNRGTESLSGSQREGLWCRVCDVSWPCISDLSLLNSVMHTLRQIKLIFVYCLRGSRQRFNTQMSALHLWILIHNASVRQWGGSQAVNPECEHVLVLTSDTWTTGSGGWWFGDPFLNKRMKNWPW